MADLTPADMRDAAGAERVAAAARGRRRWPRRLLADGARDRGRPMGVAAHRDFVAEVVRGLADREGFRVPPRG